jgi:hypothetical protein
VAQIADDCGDWIDVVACDVVVVDVVDDYDVDEEHTVVVDVDDDDRLVVDDDWCQAE